MRRHRALWTIVLSGVLCALLAGCGGSTATTAATGDGTNDSAVGDAPAGRPEASILDVRTVLAAHPADRMAAEFKSGFDDSDLFAGRIEVGEPFVVLGSDLASVAAPCRFDTSRAVAVPVEVTVTLESSLPARPAVLLHAAQDVGALGSMWFLESSGGCEFQNDMRTVTPGNGLPFGSLQPGQTAVVTGFLLGEGLVSPLHPQGDPGRLERWILGSGGIPRLTHFSGPRVVECVKEDFNNTTRYNWFAATDPESFDYGNGRCAPGGLGTTPDTAPSPDDSTDASALDADSETADAVDDASTSTVESGAPDWARCASGSTAWALQTEDGTIVRACGTTMELVYNGRTHAGTVYAVESSQCADFDESFQAPSGQTTVCVSDPSTDDSVQANWTSGQGSTAWFSEVTDRYPGD